MASSYSYGQDQDPVPVFYIGHHDFAKRDTAVTHDVVENAHSCNYDMVTAPITTHAFYSRVLHTLSDHLSLVEQDPSCDAAPPVLGSLSCANKDSPETYLEPNDIVSGVIYMTSPWIDLASPDPLIANISRQVLSLEVQYASFCGVANIVIQGPGQYHSGRTEGLSAYARAVHGALRLGPFLQFHILLPLASAHDEEDMFSLANHERPQYKHRPEEGNIDEEEPFGSWEAWDRIRSMCNYYHRLSVALTVPTDLSSSPLRSRWFSEPVRILHFPSSSFIETNRGDVMLPQLQRQLLFHFTRKSNPPWLILSGIGQLPLVRGENRNLLASSNLDPTPAQASRNTAPKAKSTIYLNHLRSLQALQPPRDAIARFTAGYQDYLQNPLQPLADNLESMTYEVFEKDPVKYDWYERATASALSDWIARGKPRSGRDGSIVIAVVGAGRGPLVTKALQAADRVGAPVDVWALEKNPNAFVLLQRYFSSKWNGRVNLARSDMRSWKGPFYYRDGDAAAPEKVHYKIDILISELLGSFADNELSPECLDGVMHLLAPNHGISIPSSYTAHLTPISAPKLHADVLGKISNGQADAAQTPYVVSLYEIDYLSTTILPHQPDRAHDRTAVTEWSETVPIIGQAWEFRHDVAGFPSVAKMKKADAGHGNEHNCRFKRLEFKCQHRGVCHGLGGYFETVLYDPAAANMAAGQNGLRDQWEDNRMEDGSFQAVKVELSTNPLTMDQKSRDMISWFPIYFPLKTPLYTPDNSLLAVSIWRQTDGRKVWYEWLVESFLLLDGGRKKVRLGSSDLHSSSENGCLL